MPSARVVSMKRKCTICSVRLDQSEMKYAGVSAYCSPDCGAKLALKLLAKKRAKEEKDADKKHAIRKREFKRHDVTRQLEATKIVFNRVRVKQEKLWFYSRNIEPYCISCQKTKMDWSCGHYKTVGSQGNLRYDKLNTYLQCNRYCNSSLSGNISGNKNCIGYTEGILSRFGAEEGAKIIEYCKISTETKKWTCQEVEKIRLTCLAEEKILNDKLTNAKDLFYSIRN